MMGIQRQAALALLGAAPDLYYAIIICFKDLPFQLLVDWGHEAWQHPSDQLCDPLSDAW